MNNETYLQLALKFKNTKCKKTFTQLYKKIVPGLKNYAYNITKDLDAAEDVVAITMARIYTKIDDYDPSYQITTWAYKIAYNDALNWLNKRSETIPLSIFMDNGYDADDSGKIGACPDVEDLLKNKDDEFKDEDFIEQDRVLQESYESVIEQIFNLKSAYKQIIIDRYIHQLSYKEIEEKNNKLVKSYSEKRTFYINNLISTGKIEEAKIEKMLLNRYIKNNMLNMQTVKNRINRGRDLIINSLENKKEGKIS